MEWTGVMGFTESGAPKVGRVLSADGKVVEGQYISYVVVLLRRGGGADHFLTQSGIYRTWDE